MKNPDPPFPGHRGTCGQANKKMVEFSGTFQSNIIRIK